MRRPKGRRHTGILEASLISINSVSDSNDPTACVYKSTLQINKMEGNGKQKVPKATWPPYFEKLLLGLVKNQQMTPGCKRFNITEDQLNAITAEFKGSTGMSLTTRQLRGKLERWIKDWRVWKKLLLHSSSLGYRGKEGMILSDDWDALERMIPGAASWNGKAFPLFDELDELLSDQMTNERKAISPNHIPQSSRKFVAIDDSDEYDNLGGDSDECESQLPQEKRKGKRSA